MPGRARLAASVADVVGARDFHPGVDEVVGFVGLEAAVFHRGEDFEYRVVAIQLRSSAGPKLR
jgi:hypothetical protein